MGPELGSHIPAAYGATYHVHMNMCARWCATLNRSQMLQEEPQCVVVGCWWQVHLYRAFHTVETQLGSLLCSIACLPSSTRQTRDVWCQVPHPFPTTPWKTNGFEDTNTAVLACAMATIFPRCTYSNFAIPPLVGLRLVVSFAMTTVVLYITSCIFGPRQPSVFMRRHMQQDPVTKPLWIWVVVPVDPHELACDASWLHAFDRGFAWFFQDQRVGAVLFLTHMFMLFSQLCQNPSIFFWHARFISAHQGQVSFRTVTYILLIHFCFLKSQRCNRVMFAHPIHGGAQKNFICCQGWYTTLSPTLSKIQIRYIQMCQNCQETLYEGESDWLSRVCHNWVSRKRTLSNGSRMLVNLVLVF